MTRRPAADRPAEPAATAWPALHERARAGGMGADDMLMVVDVRAQKLTVLHAGKPLGTFWISTSRFGIGNREQSNQTPLGLHRVADRIGDGEPPGRVFQARALMARIIPESEWARSTGEDLVLTRILRLRGVEPGVNQGAGIDSYARCIYIHGTNEEHRLGQPASHGCIRMFNRDVVSLFNALKGREAWCLIVPAV